MKKIVLGLATAAALVSPLALAGSANADTPRVVTGPNCQILVSPATTTKTTVTSPGDIDQSWYEGTFTVSEPAGAVDQFDNTWVHHITYKAALDMEFTGEGYITGSDINGTQDTITEKVTGQEFPGADKAWSGDDNTINLHIERSDGRTYDLVDAPLNGTVTNAATFPTVDWAIQMIVSNPLADQHLVQTHEADTVDTVETTVPAVYRQPVNHGDYVSAMGGGSAAAQSSCGMPIQAQTNKA